MNDTDTRVNWREIDSTTEAGRRALDVEIARRLGKNAFTALNEREWQFDQNREWVSEYYVEDGRIYEVAYYTSDLNAAASLPIDDIYHWEIRVYLEGITNAGIIPNAFFDVKEHREDADTEALARCKAWLAWHDAKSDKLSASDTD